jgi:hypothetical protein
MKKTKKLVSIQAEYRTRILPNTKQSASHSTATIAKCTMIWMDTQTSLQQRYSEHTGRAREGNEGDIYVKNWKKKKN